MHNYVKTGVVISACLVLGYLAFAKFTEPKTYEDCILANVTDTENEQAARSVAMACRVKFPKEKPNYDDIFGVVTK